jgi:GrpB-like predicted nucleotidyltransferase (UPF0157 family)
MSSVTIVPYSNDWPLQFAPVRANLLAAFADVTIQVEHIGSTSVPGLAAKPIIDVLLGAGSLTDIESRTEALELIGYQYISKYEKELPMRRYFFKPEAHSSLRVNLHAVVLSSPFWHEHIAFRDALRSDRSLVAEYCSLKTELAARFPHDRPSYTAAKAPFIQSTLNSLHQAMGANYSLKRTAANRLGVD